MRLPIFLLFIFSFLVVHFSFAQQKNALIIGIDQYTPTKDYKPTINNGRTDFYDLDGCVNDALSMRSVMVSRFQFQEDQIETLFNRAATRDNILTGMNKLLYKSKKGDIAFIYYAGHGSQVHNSKSKEADKKDETIVPADTWQEGVEDIRDKELSKKFNEFLDKGIKLTVIMDCCHSASMSRGGPVLGRGKIRFMPSKDASVYDANDPSTPTPPETRKEGSFLILSASQDNELAEEQLDDNSPSQSHGAFTLALLHALNQQSVDVSALNLFISTRAILKSNGKKQEPVLSTTWERSQQTLLDIRKGILPDKLEVAVSGVDKQRKQVLLQGGFATGIYKGNELMRASGKDTITLIVDTVLSVNRSLSSVTKGTIDNIKGGEFFEVTNWASSQAPLLKIYIPRGDYNYEKVMELTRLDKELKASAKVKWINDLEKTDPDVSVYFDRNKSFIHANGLQKELNDLSAREILAQSKQNATLYFEFPAVHGLFSVLSSRLLNRPVKIVDNPNQANYLVFGVIDEDGQPAYGLRRVQTSARDSLESMPIKTKTFTLKDNSIAVLNDVSDSLFEYAMKLCRIRGWLQLASPKGAESVFPYHLEMLNTTTGKPITNATYKVGDNIALHLVANSDYMRYAGGQRYLYIFGIDKSGAIQLFYPEVSDGNMNNRFPRKEGNETIKDLSIASYAVPEPSGTDNFFLLATSDPIPDYTLQFNQEGVRGKLSYDTPFGALLGMGDINNTRGFPKTLPNNWSLQKVFFKCTH